MSVRDLIQAKQDRKVSEPIPCPEWGEGVALRVRSLTGEERDAFEESCLERKGKRREPTLRNIRAKLVVLAACDEAGEPVFRAGDEAWLGGKSAAAIDRLFSVAQRLSGLSDEDLEELQGNFKPAQSAGSGSS